MTASADLQVAIRAVDDASATLRNVGQLTRDLGGHAQAAAPGFATLTGAMTAATIASQAMFGIVGGLFNVFKDAATSAATFEQKMSGIQAVSGASADQMKTLSALALQLGKDTSFSASEAADGISELSKAGVSVADIMGGAAKASLDLAAAGGVSVAESAEIASNAMNVFNLKGKDMAHVADEIAGAANASAIDVGDYKFSLAAAGAVAATVGVSFDDLSTAIAVMGQAGIKGSDAGTSLKTMLLNLTPSSKSASEEMKALGIITADGSNQFFDATGKAKSMADIAGVLQHATAGLTEQQRLQALQTMFGTDAIRAAAVMAKAGASGFDDMAASIGKITAEDVANTRLDNLKGSIEQLKGSAETLAITFGLKLLPSVRAMTDRATAFLNALIPLAGALDLDDLLSGVSQDLQDLGDDVLATARFFGDLGDRVEEWPVIGRIASTAFGVLDDVITGLAMLLRGDVDNAVVAFEQALTDLRGPLGDVATWLGGMLRDAISWLVATGWPAYLAISQTLWTFVGTTVVPIVQTLVGWLKDHLPPVLTWLVTTGWPLLLGAMQAASTFISTTLVPAISAVWSWLSDNLPPVLNWLIDTGWPNLLGAIRVVATFITGTVVPAVANLINWLRDHVPPAIAGVLSAFQAVRDRLAPIVQAVFGGDLATALAGLGSAFADFATLALGWLGAQVARIDWHAVWARAVDVAGTMAQWFASLAGRLAGWIADQVEAIDWSAVWSRARDVVVEMAQWFTALASKLATWISAEVAQIDWAGVWARAVNVATSMAQWFLTVATDFAAWISAKVSEIDWANVWTRAKNVASSMAQWFVTLAEDFATWIGDKAKEIDWTAVWGKVVGFAEAAAAKFTDEAASIDWGAVLAGATSAATDMLNWLTRTIESIDWSKAGETFGAWLGWAVVNAISEIAGLARAIATWVSDSIVGAFNGDGADTPAGQFLKALDGMIHSVETAVGNFFLGMLKGAWSAAISQFTPTLPTLPGIVTGHESYVSPGGGPMPSPPSTPPASGGGGAAGNYGAIDNSSRASFVKTAYPYMLQAAGGNADLAQMMLAAAISENGDVGKGGSFVGNNFFGIKGAGDAGSFQADTWEMVNGQRVNISDKFAAYSSPVAGFGGFMDFLQSNSRYKPALAAYQQSGDASQLFHDINAAGYATDTGWAGKIDNIRANQVVPNVPTVPTGGGGAVPALTPDQKDQITAGLAAITASLNQSTAAFQTTTQASTTFTNTLPDAQASLSAVSAALQGQFASLQATGTADKDLVRDTLPTINTLEQQGTITSGTATQLRSMALAILNAGTATTQAQPNITAGTDVMDAFGATINDATLNIDDLADATRVNVIDPRVDTGQVDQLAAAADAAKKALLATDDVPITPVVNEGQLASATNDARSLAGALASADDVPIVPQVDLTQINAGKVDAGQLGTAIAASDDTPSIPQVVTGYIDNAKADAAQLGTAVAASDDVASIPQVVTGYIDGAIRDAGLLGTAIVGSDDTPSIPQVVTGYIDGARADVVQLGNAIVASDDTPSVPVVNTGNVDTADGKVNALTSDLSHIDTVHALTFSGNVPSSVTVNSITGNNADLNNANLNGVGDISTGGDITVDNDIRVKDNLGVGNNLVTNKSIIDPNFTFNFASGGRPPLNVASMVGELGPELFVPDGAGTIIPASTTASILSGLGRRSGGAFGSAGAGAGGSMVVLNLTVTGNTILGEDRGVAQQLADLIKPELDRRVSI